MKCNLCGGSGERRRQVTCLVCMGKGVQKLRVDTKGPVVRECPQCHGTKSVIEYTTCPRCKGKGSI